LQAVKRYGLRVTLSTNGIRSATRKDILGHLDEIGIPIDGSTPQVPAAVHWTVRWAWHQFVF
jgi:MoaA/NifB/PqqE/SkfB family radical SAM enzyme